MTRYIFLPPVGTRAESGTRTEEILTSIIGSARSTLPSIRRNFGEVFDAVAPDIGEWAKSLGQTPDASPLDDLRGRLRERIERARDRAVEVIDAIHENGAKLIDLDDEAADILSRSSTQGRLAPVIEYQYNPAPSIQPVSRPPGTAAPLTLQVVNAVTGQPVPDVNVTFLTNAAGRIGDTGKSDGSGNVVLRVGPAPVVGEIVYAEAPASGYWGTFRENVTYLQNDELRLAPIESAPDPIGAIRAHPSNQTAGAGVKIAVVDSGVGPNALIGPSFALNTVTGEPANDVDDNGVGHGTHIAGIIGGGGADFPGIAPGVEIHNYRVEGAGADPPTSYSIMKAMDRAADNGCDIINLSLSTETDDIAVREAIRDVNLRGCVVVAAAGNGWRDTIAEPARFDEAIAVAAFGDATVLPPDSDAFRYVGQPVSPLAANEFVAAFSNMAGGGSVMGLIAPGVGIVSLSIGQGYRIMHGTSMATAIVSGQIARILSAQPAIMNMPRDHSRSVAIRQLAFSLAKRRGFGMPYEGYGSL